MVEDGDELPLEGRVQHVAVHLQVLHHHIHHVDAQLHGDDVGPVGLSSLQRGSRALLPLQPAPILAGQDDALLQAAQWKQVGFHFRVAPVRSARVRRVLISRLKITCQTLRCFLRFNLKIAPMFQEI